jgi:hypothetical protein
LGRTTSSRSCSFGEEASIPSPERFFQFIDEEPGTGLEHEATEAAMTAVDRLGFFLRLKTSEGMKGVRINFLREVETPQDTRKVLVEMVCAAEIAR